MDMEIKLGDITISIPPERKIDFTGQRAIVKYDVPGDRPRYQDMGRDERTVRWNGIFYGSADKDGKSQTAYEQALALQDYYDSNKNVDNGDSKSGFLFTFNDISCKVIIKNYSYQYYRQDKVRYDIELVRLESDFDEKKKKEDKSKTDKAAKAKNGLEKLKDDINKVMKNINKITQAARNIQKQIYNVRKQYLDVVKSITNPINQMKTEIGNVKSAFDKALQTVNYSIGRTNTYSNKQQLYTSLQTLQKVIPTAQTHCDVAQTKSVSQRLADAISQLTVCQIVQGDTLRTISSIALGNPHLWTILAKVNNLTSDIIPAGVTTIRIPDSSNLVLIESLLTEQKNQIPDAQSNYLPKKLR